jgi:hypothetical protein
VPCKLLAPMSPAANLHMASASDVQSLASNRGSISVWQVAPGVYASCVRGHLDAKMARLIIKVGEPLYALGPVAGFHDWLEMTGYESQSRVDLTKWVLSHREQSRLFIGVRSKLVAMGVSVANLALGNLIEVHSSARTLESALDRVLAKPPAKGIQAR